LFHCCIHFDLQVVNLSTRLKVALRTRPHEDWGTDLFISLAHSLNWCAANCVKKYIQLGGEGNDQTHLIGDPLHAISESPAEGVPADGFW
jgi:hypothetical protein